MALLHSGILTFVVPRLIYNTLISVTSNKLNDMPKLAFVTVQLSYLDMEIHKIVVFYDIFSSKFSGF